MTRLWLGAGAVVLLVLGLWWFGQAQYSKGYQDRSTEVLLAQKEQEAKDRAKEHELQTLLEEKERENYVYQKQADANIRAANDAVARLQHTISTQSKQLETARTSAFSDGVAAACWIALEESVRGYAEMGEIADGYVERLRQGQNWAKVVQRSQ